MASIISSGIGSGLDVSGLVSQLVAAEGQPAEERILRGEATAQAKLSAYGSIKSALSEFRDQLEIMKDLNQFLTRTAGSGNEDLFTVSAATNALPASYAVEVVQLASAQKLTSAAFADEETVVGTGTLQIDVGGTAFSLEITEENNTLEGIRDAINAASDNSGVAATIVNADAGSYLILSGDKTGADAAITVTQSDGDGGLAALEYDPGNGLNSLTETSAAQDALIRIDGFDVTSDNNSISGAIDGVTIDLVQAAVGTTETLTVANDTAEVRRTITEFVESYNQLVTTFDGLSSYDAESQIAGPLLGDASLRSIRDQLRREMSVSISQAGATFGTLREIGVETELNGQMKVVEEDLTEVLNNDFTAVGQLFASESGFALRLFDVVDGFLGDDGLLTTRTEGLNQTIERYSDQRDSLNERLASLETRLLRQFNAMDALVGQLTTTSNFLTQQLASLPTVGGSNQ
ncbi:MAG: flagellar filament capping protein FliD [Woeseia sp.]|nr:flagellar filament capping protein FliD [Woeseia sp.]NNE60043.1 flagellar filament capping protein FliD [Woeseia sp.]NNL54254.1 flagellar filament capping protein FliD [Woeseia sp.]